MRYKVGVISLGCNKNRVDTETALGLLKEHGYDFTPEMEKADLLLVNTCGFIESAREESINTILEMAEHKKTGRCRLLIVTGCLAQRYEKELLAAIPEIDILLGVNQYAQLPAIIDQALNGEKISLCQDDHSYFEHERLLTTPFYSAYIRIGEGCSNHCSFCAIPDIRGPYRSRKKETILQEMKQLVTKGVREHILVAQDTTRYGWDLDKNSRLPDLMEKAAQLPGVDWLRVLYCYPDETSIHLLDLIANTENICSYLDLPVQHIHPNILKKMRRRGTREDILRCVNEAKKRNITLRTSLIVGFPGETDEQFQDLIDFIQEARFDRLGVFVYSPEEGTPAASLPDQIPETVKQERLDRVMTLQQSISLELNRKRIGSVEKMLVTDVDTTSSMCLGRTEREAPETDGELYVTYSGKVPEIGSFISVKITGADIYDLTGERL